MYKDAANVFILLILQEEIFLQKYKCTNIWAYIHEKKFFANVQKVKPIKFKKLFCAKVQMHKLGENLQQKYENQSQRLQLLVESLLHFSYLHIFWIFYNAHHHHHPQNRQGHHYHNHRSHHLNRHHHYDYYENIILNMSWK